MRAGWRTDVRVPTGKRHCVNGYALIFVPEGNDPAEVLAMHRRAAAEATAQ